MSPRLGGRMMRVARCHCGAVEAACEGEPRKVSLCHCRDCQRRTGSAFSVAVFYPKEQVRPSGETRAFAASISRRL